MGTAVKQRMFAVITGGSSGIGYELAAVFASEGYDLMIIAEDAGVQTAAHQLTAAGAHVEAVQADLRTRAGVEHAISAVRGAGRHIDALALNAGVGIGGDFLRQTDLDQEIDMISLNCIAVVHLAKKLIPMMVERGEGRVLITSSIAATMPAPFEAVYGATKAFDLSFAEALRNELKDTGVVVTALQPGPTDTNFFHRAGMDDTKVGQAEKDDPAQVARQAFDALIAGKDKVYAGSFKTRMEGHMTEILPEPTKAERHRKLAEPGGGEKH